MEWHIGNGMYFKGTPKEIMQVEKLMNKQDQDPKQQLMNLIDNLMNQKGGNN